MKVFQRHGAAAESFLLRHSLLHTHTLYLSFGNIRFLLLLQKQKEGVISVAKSVCAERRRERERESGER